MGKSLLQSKTFWVNFLVAVIAICTGLSDLSLISENPQAVALIGTLIGAGNIVLRTVTKEPIKQ